MTPRSTNPPKVTEVIEDHFEAGAIREHLKLIVLNDEVESGHPLQKGELDGSLCIRDDPGGSQDQLRLDGVLGYLVINRRHDHQWGKRDDSHDEDRNPPQPAQVERVPPNELPSSGLPQTWGRRPGVRCSEAGFVFFTWSYPSAVRPLIPAPFHLPVSVSRSRPRCRPAS